MKLLVLVTVIVAVNAIHDEELWKQFKVKHGKNYRSLLEEQFRFEIFQQNVRSIEEHNEKYENGESSYKKGINKFADLTREEFKANILMKSRKTLNGTSTLFRKPFIGEAPNSIDWRSKGAVTGIKDQGSCGDCWAFSSTASIESAYFLKTGELVELSEQDLVDCSGAYGNIGCMGGWMNNAFDYVKDNGIAKLADYPDTGTLGSCQNVAKYVSIQGYVKLEQNEAALKEAVGTIAPVAVALDADFLDSYTGGVFDNSACTHNLDHEALVVGYGYTDGKDYWLVKNSWGEDWGENGYIKMVRNKDSQCGIADDAGYPVL